MEPRIRGSELSVASCRWSSRRRRSISRRSEGILDLVPQIRIPGKKKLACQANRPPSAGPALERSYGTIAHLDPPTTGLLAFGPPHDPRGPGVLHGGGERLEQGCHRPRAPSAAGVHPHLAQARPARDAGGLRHLLGEPAEGAQGQEPADGAAHERGGRQDATVQALQGAEASGPVGFSLWTGAQPRVRSTAVRFILAFSVMLWLAAPPARGQE